MGKALFGSLRGWAERMGAVRAAPGLGGGTVTHELPAETSAPGEVTRVLGPVLLHLRLARLCNVWHTQSLKLGLRRGHAA